MTALPDAPALPAALQTTAWVSHGCRTSIARVSHKCRTSTSQPCAANAPVNPSHTSKAPIPAAAFLTVNYHNQLGLELTVKIKATLYKPWIILRVGGCSYPHTMPRRAGQPPATCCASPAPSQTLITFFGKKINPSHAGTAASDHPPHFCIALPMRQLYVSTVYFSFKTSE